MDGWRFILIIAALIVLAGSAGIYLYSSRWDNYSSDAASPDSPDDGCESSGDGICNSASPVFVSLSEDIPVMKDPKPVKTPKIKKTPKPTDTPEHTDIPEHTKTPKPTVTPKKTSTPIPTTPKPTQTIEPTPVPTSLAELTPVPTETPEVTDTQEPTETELANPAVTPADTQIITPAITPDITPDITPAVTPTPTLADSQTLGETSIPVPSPDISTGLAVSPESQAINNTVDINYNVSGAGNISLLITYPNGTVAELLNTSTTVASFIDTLKFKIPQFGEYTAKIIASNPAGDTSSNSTKFYGMEVITTSTKIPAGNVTPLIIHKGMILEAAANDTANGNIELTAKIAPSNICIGAGAITPVKAIKYVGIDTAAAEHISNVTLKINYSSEDISGLDENTLSLYYWDNVSNTWYRTGDYAGKETPDGLYVYDSGVDTTIKYAWAKLDHFGVFALGGTPASAGSTGVPSNTTTPSDIASSDTISPSGTTSDGEESSPSSGGGGSSSSAGGGGGTSGEDYKNIEKIEKYEKTLYRDLSTNYQFSQNGVVDSVNITGNINVDSVNVIVEVLRDISSFADAQAPGLVYRNVNIWVGTSGFATPRNIKEATITFRVNRTWLDSNNVSDVVLYRYTDGEWVALPTMNPQKNEITGDYAVYSATTDRFSPFAVAGVKEEVSATRQATAQKQSQKSAATAVSTKKAQSQSEDWGAAMTVALVGIVAAALAFIRKKMM